MFRPRIIPVLLIRNGGLVKTVKFGAETYVGDPMNAVRLFNKFEADELVFLDIDAYREGRTISPKLVQQIGAEAMMPFSVGGGIRTLEQARELIKAGAEKDVVRTSAIENPTLITHIAEQFGNQSVVVCIDAKKDSREIEALAMNAEKHRAGEIIIQSIDQDGTMAGYDLALIQRVAKVTSVPIIALGGAGTYEHLTQAVHAGASAVAVGSMFVFFSPRRSVLINYPSKKERNEIFIKA